MTPITVERYRQDALADARVSTSVGMTVGFVPILILTICLVQLGCNVSSVSSVEGFQKTSLRSDYLDVATPITAGSESSATASLANLPNPASPHGCSSHAATGGDSGFGSVDQINKPLKVGTLRIPCRPRIAESCHYRIPPPPTKKVKKGTILSTSPAPLQR